MTDLESWLESGSSIDLDALPEVEENSWRRIVLLRDRRVSTGKTSLRLREGTVFTVFEGAGSEYRRVEQAWIRLPERAGERFGFARLEPEDFEFLDDDGKDYEKLPFVYQKAKPKKGAKADATVRQNNGTQAKNE